MKRQAAALSALLVLLLALSLVAVPASSPAAPPAVPAKITALVGGRLIDGYGRGPVDYNARADRSARVAGGGE